MVKDEVLLTLLRDAEMLAIVFELTFVVFITKDPEVRPAAIVTEPGSVAEALSLNRVTTKPPNGAGELIVTVPDEDFPPITDAGLSERETRLGGLIVSEVVFDEPLTEPVIATTF